MPELAIQRFLRERRDCPTAGVLQYLDDTYGVSARRHSEHPELVLLKYDQIRSPFAEELVRDCRGIILNEADDWAVVCLTYRKFFNHGESHAAEIDWASARFYEKLDGSLIQAYFYKGEWHVATSGTPDGTAPVGDFGTDFRSLFWKTAVEGGWGRGGHMDSDRCYAFELCTSLNRVVVRHDTPTVWLHGVRNRVTLQEEDPRPEAERIDIPVAPSHPFSGLDEVLAASRGLDPLAHEGYVVIDRHFNRVKVKSPAYVALHHAKDGLLSRRMMANVIRRGEAEELRTALDAFPELAVEFDRIQALHAAVVYDAAIQFAYLLATLPLGFTRKQYAVEATRDPRLAGVLFRLLDRHQCRALAAGEIPGLVRDYFATISERSYADLIGLKDAADPIRKEIAA